MLINLQSKVLCSTMGVEQLAIVIGVIDVAHQLINQAVIASLGKEGGRLDGSSPSYDRIFADVRVAVGLHKSRNQPIS